MNTEEIKEEIVVEETAEPVYDITGNDNKNEREELLKQKEQELLLLKMELDEKSQKIVEDMKLSEQKLAQAKAAEDKANSLMQDAVSKRKSAEERMMLLDAREENLKKQNESLARKTDILNQREINIQNREMYLESELSQKRIDFNNEITQLREEKTSEINEVFNKADSERLQKMAELFQQSEKHWENELTSLKNDIIKWQGEQRKLYIQNLESEQKKYIEMTSPQLSEINSKLNELKEKQDKLNNDIRVFHDEQDKFNEEKESVARQKRLFELRERELKNRENAIDDEAEEMAQRKSENIISELNTTKDRCENLSRELERCREEMKNYHSLSIACNGDPKYFETMISKYQSQINEYKNKIENLPSKDEVDDYYALTNDYEKMRESMQQLLKNNRALAQEVEEKSNIDLELQRKKRENENLENEIQQLTQEKESLREKLMRLCTSENHTAERGDRIKALFDVDKSQVMFDKDAEQPFDEIEWLKHILKCCQECSIVFPKRILYAFHTALKIADWSTITVLAGVSGTGKSELPRLYSMFGGINFISVAVQPNWDSQESMLGYFNSIDNRFDAQPLLRFLVKSTENFESNDMAEIKPFIDENYESWNDYMSLILLDEMNLAHVELYFADFLSKLETRRGKASKYVPTIEVKLGAGIEPYKLKLSRNLLFTGTMNQDETTKSLSDKVLDRGIVINFPRPKKLIERNKLANLDKIQKKNNVPMLRHDVWKQWQVTEVFFSDEQKKEIEKYKNIVEKINEYLSSVGRAIGHRVWQSIEFYIANYPEVRAAKEKAGEQLTDKLRSAMHTAFEDQIVQKIMPKLRGIDTKGRGRSRCLDLIKSLLEEDFNLSKDFENACELGYGQFIWSSSEYIETEDSYELETNELEDGEESV